MAFAKTLRANSVSNVSERIISASTDTTSSTFIIFFSRRISAPITNAAAEIRNIIVPQNSDEPVSLSLTGFTIPSPTSNNVPTKCINQSLVVVGEQIGLPFNLSMHVARHSFAVFALNKGLSMTVVSRLLGHGSTDVTEKVYARFLPETLSTEVARLFLKYD